MAKLQCPSLLCHPRLQSAAQPWEKNRMATQLKFGLLLPHFGSHASIEKCLDGARKAEAYGFDSVWVRDHLVFEPHGIEGVDRTHIEGLLTLSAVASVTQRLILGTSMVICHRHPIHLAQLFAGLSRISHGRLIMGLGLGGFPHEFVAAGLPSTLADRSNLARINAEICRRLWAGEKVSHAGEFFDFKEVELKPIPTQPIPIWCGGGTPAACRRAVQYGDGWMPARITLATFKKCIAYLRELCRAAGRPMVTAAVMPFTSIADDKAAALSAVPVQALIAEANKFSTWVRPLSGSFSTLEDIEGLLLAGTPPEIVRDIRAYEGAGADHIVFDLRFRYADWYEQIDLLGAEVLPQLAV